MRRFSLAGPLGAAAYLLIAWAEPAVSQATATDGVNGDPPEYESAGKRDPFRPLSLARESGPVRAEPRTVLERYELGQLRLVGVVHQTNPPRAMVEDSAGLGFILTPGTPVGRHGGVVAEIRSREVVVEEWHTDVIGRRHRTEHVIELPTDEEGSTP